MNYEHSEAAQREQDAEPVAYIKNTPSGPYVRSAEMMAEIPEAEDGLARSGWMPLYASPPKRKPLTKGQMEAVMGSLNVPLTGFRGWGWLQVIRAVERAHGIGDE